MGSDWKELGSWNVGTPDGSVEKYTLSENAKTGDFRIQNDFGNITIDMERMSGYEFLKKAIKEIESKIVGTDTNDWFDNLVFDDDDDNDCDHTD